MVQTSKNPLLVAAVSALIVSILAMTSISMVKASPSPSFDVKVEHFVEIRESGLLVINDTVTLLNASPEFQPIQNYVLGFPINYQYDLARVFAFETVNPSSRLSVDLNTGIGKIGFYGVQVNFPSPVDIRNGGSFKFTVVFVFSDRISFSVSSAGEIQSVSYNASFPASPSLSQDASEVSVNITLPSSLSYSASSFEKEGISLANATENNSRIFSFVKNNVAAFSDQPAWVYASKTGGAIQLLAIQEVDRKIEILGNGQLRVLDSYSARNKAGKLESVQLKLLKDAYDVSAIDEFGLVQAANLKVEQTDSYTNVTITFAVPHEEADEVRFSVQYSLPWKNYVTLGGGEEYGVSLSLYENFDWVIVQLSTTVALPEGAILTSSINRESLNGFENTAFSTSFAFTYQNVTPFQDFQLSFTYRRSIFWDSFRPTVWLSSFVLVASAIVGAWRVYRPSPTAPLPTAVIGLQAEELKNFVSSYEEKRRLQKEGESLEIASRKGKIPRRQYKVRKKTIDSRIMALSRDLVALRDRLRAAGPRFADLMRQLEVAETELQGAGTEVNSAEIRYRKGDLSPQAYHNVLETAYRRRDRAQTTIDGVLLRLREEVS